ncbi:MAG: hypothetical protein ACRCZO_06880 [Cetobacterium sp.]
MELILNEKKYEFQKIELNFIEKNLKNLFNLKNNKTLLETLKHKKYQKLNTEFLEFKNDFKTPLGIFLEKLKVSEDKRYKLFLNRYGDREYCKFRIESKDIWKLKGLYAYTLNGKIVYIGRCCDSFYRRINNGYGRISPKNCYKDGQQTNCHINSLINESKENIEFWIYPMHSVEKIKELEVILIKEYNPKWNIALIER